MEIFLYFCFSLLIFKDVMNFGLKGVLAMTAGAILLATLLYYVEAVLLSRETGYYLTSSLVWFAGVSLIANYRRYMRERLNRGK